MSPRAMPPADRLSVKEVADLAGVTPRTVRYYHSVGLLPEPERDSSGYRRYGGTELTALVRITRLRAVGMPISQIAERLSETADASQALPSALGALADEIDGEIAQLTATRDRLRELAASGTFDQPVEALTQALQAKGVLGPAEKLRSGEGWAASVLDALHPDGIPGVLAQASQLFADPTTLAALVPLRKRLGRLNEHTSEEEMAALAADVAAVLPPEGGDGPIVDIGLIDVLLTDRLNPTQRRFMNQLRTRSQEKQ